MLGNGLREELDDVEVFALICTAVAHDCGHPGKSNLFLVETKSEKAKRWNNEAVNENGHVEFAIEAFEKCEVFRNDDDDVRSSNRRSDEKNRSEEMKETVYEILKTAILYTDMNKHETLIEDFREALYRNRGKKAIKEWAKKEDVHVALGYVLHCADVLNGCRPWPVAKKWAELITEEFCKQGDVEKSLGFEKLTGAHVDRALRTDITSSRQAIKFAEETVKPLYGLLKEIVPNAVEPLLTQLELNVEKHRALIQESQR
jgi:tetratricopeptide (TPR) repeat protein